MLDNTERTARGEAFRTSLAAGRITPDKLRAALAGWVRAGMASDDDTTVILAIALAPAVQAGAGADRSQEG